MSSDAKLFLFSLFLGIALGIAGATVQSRFSEQKALAEAALQSEFIREEMMGTIKALSFHSSQQQEKINSLSNLLARVSSLANEEVGSVQDALKIIARMKKIVKEMP